RLRGLCRHWQGTGCKRWTHASEGEARGLIETQQARRDGVEQLAADPLALALARDERGAHDRLAADDGDQLAAHFQLIEQALRHGGDRARQHDGVERRLAWLAWRAIAFDHAG